MLLKPLTDALALVSDRIKNFEREFTNNEQQTRLSLVDPVLKALGWDPQDPTTVKVEYQVRQRNRNNIRVDYALLDSKQEPVAFVEAKKLGTDLGPAQLQLFEYAVGKSVPYAIATNGADWSIYKQEQTGTDFHAKRLLMVAIPDQSPTVTAVKLLSLWRGLLTSQSSIDQIAPALDTLETQLPKPETASVLTSRTATEEDYRQPVPRPVSPKPLVHETTVDHSVEAFTLRDPPDVTHRKPARLTLPGGMSRQIGSWKSLLEEVVTWLYDTNQLKVNMPWPGIPNSTRNILQNTKILYKDGTEYTQQVEIKPDLFLQLKLGSVAICEHIAKLLTDCEIDSSEVSVTLVPLKR